MFLCQQALTPGDPIARLPIQPDVTVRDSQYHAEPTPSGPAGSCGRRTVVGLDAWIPDVG